MNSTAPFTSIPFFIRTASGSLQCPFLFEEKEQAEVGQSPTFYPYATATGFEAFSRNALVAVSPLNREKRIPRIIPKDQKI